MRNAKLSERFTNSVCKSQKTFQIFFAKGEKSLFVIRKGIDIDRIWRSSRYEKYENVFKNSWKTWRIFKMRKNCYKSDFLKIFWIFYKSFITFSLLKRRQSPIDTLQRLAKYQKKLFSAFLLTLFSSHDRANKDTWCQVWRLSNVYNYRSKHRELQPCPFLLATVT